MRSRRKRKNEGRVAAIVIAVLAVAAGLTGGSHYYIQGLKKVEIPAPDELFAQYTPYLAHGRYKDMYDMLGEQSRQEISLEDFVIRDKNIYEGIEAGNIQSQTSVVEEPKEHVAIASYQMSPDTIAEPASFPNQVTFVKSREDNLYRMAWSDRVTFPEFGSTDKVRVFTERAERGQIYDGNGTLLTGKGAAFLAGPVPSKMQEDPSSDLERLSELLSISTESIEKRLSAGWVKDDSLVPTKTLKKVDKLNLQSQYPTESSVQNRGLQDTLLAIPGAMITDTQVCTYPLGEQAAHLVGYVQNVTAEDLKKRPGKGYLADSVIGRGGMGALLEKEPKGINGCTATIIRSGGSLNRNLASIPKQDGTDITLTIDSDLQRIIYQAFETDRNCTAAMDPWTGEILALVGTPSYDNNDFILGTSQDKWIALNEDFRNPLLSRFRQKFASGSSFKPIAAAIGLASKILDPNEDYGNEGRSWQKDRSWGNYYVTTLRETDPANLENALVFSDNIYSAKAALNIGYDTFVKSMDRLGSGQELPFEIAVAESQYSNTETIETEIQLADSGYRQGQILVNPIHLASLYTMFPNQGTIIKPWLIYEVGVEIEPWLDCVLMPEITDCIVEGMKKVISSEHGTGRAAFRSDPELAGKMGTAEIRASKSNTSSTELDWFVVYTTDPGLTTPVLLVNMVEDVKNAGGNGLVVREDKAVLDAYIPPS